MIHFLIRDLQINIASVIGLTLRTGAGCASLFFPVPAFEVRILLAFMRLPNYFLTENCLAGFYMLCGSDRIF